MIFRAFSLRNVFFGVLLGLLIVAGWLYHEDVLSVLKSSSPKVIDMAKNMNLGEKVKMEIPFLKGEQGLSKGDKSQGLENKPVPSHRNEMNEMDKDYSVPNKKIAESKPLTQKEDERMFPLKEFDSVSVAKRFIESVKKSSGIELKLGQQNYRYVVYIQARNESERDNLVTLIRNRTGLEDI